MYRLLVDFDPMNCNWTDRSGTQTWNVAGVIGGTDIADTPFATFQWPYGAPYADVDITDAVRNWNDGVWENHGALIKFVDESSDQSGPYCQFATNGLSIGQSGAIDVVYNNPSTVIDLTTAVTNWVNGSWANNGVCFIAEDNVNESGYRQLSVGGRQLVVTVLPDSIPDPPHTKSGSLEIEYTAPATSDMNYWIEAKADMSAAWETVSDTITTNKQNTSGSLSYIATGDSATAPVNFDRMFYRIRREDALQYP